MKWLIWLAFLVISFAAMEAYSLYDHTATLSRFVWQATEAFPPLPFIAGFLSGGLAVHFWWTANPFNEKRKKERQAADAAKRVKEVLRTRTTISDGWDDGHHTNG